MALGRKKVEEVAPKGRLQVLNSKLAEVTEQLDDLYSLKVDIADQRTIAMGAMDTVKAQELQLQYKSVEMQIARLADERYQLNHSIGELQFNIDAARSAYGGAKRHIDNLASQREKLIADHEQALTRIDEDIAKEHWELSSIKAELEELGGEV